VPFWSPTFSVTEERSEPAADALLLAVAEEEADEDDDEHPAAASPATAMVRAA
jgi:hypothetical protein